MLFAVAEGHINDHEVRGTAGGANGSAPFHRGSTGKPRSSKGPRSGVMVGEVVGVQHGKTGRCTGLWHWCVVTGVASEVVG